MPPPGLGGGATADICSDLVEGVRVLHRGRRQVVPDTRNGIGIGIGRAAFDRAMDFQSSDLCLNVHSTSNDWRALAGRPAASWR
ncbi:hypothetical protein ACFWVP_19295 [Streptomyces sp. NPDC058637]|uniref:hypothetical protein n=1 Tax=Streptomyces sp. NPDC058637 TaxID=3346569 RepID=UPI0036468D51